MVQHYANVLPDSAISQIRLDDGAGTTYTATGIRPEWLHIPEYERGHGATLTVHAAGYVTHEQRVTLGGDPCLASVSLATATPPALPRLRADGLEIRDANGKRWVYNGATAFLDLELMLMGEEPARYAGANVRRFFVTCANLSGQAGRPPLSPATFPNWRDGLERLAQWYQHEGIYGDCCVLADCGALGLDVPTQQRIVAEAAETIAPYSNMLFDLGNEPWNNQWDRRNFSRPNLQTLVTRGSYTDDDSQDGYKGADPWDGYRVHTRRDFPKMLAHCALPTVQYDYSHIVIVDEPFKCGESDIPNKQYTNPRFFAQAGALGRSINGICFHTEAGCYSQPLGPQQDACRRAFFDGL